MEKKFRAWDKKNNVMIVYNPILSSPQFVVDCGGAIMTSKDPGKVKNDEWVLMQYIGRKDRNGVEIYEGDKVLKRDTLDKEGTEIVVEWRYHLLYDLEKSDLEVIGHIYENPTTE